MTKQELYERTNKKETHASLTCSEDTCVYKHNGLFYLCRHAKKNAQKNYHCVVLCEPLHKNTEGFIAHKKIKITG